MEQQPQEPHPTKENFGTILETDRFLPNTLIRIVVDHLGNDVTDQYSVETLDKKMIPGQMDALLDNQTLMETTLPNMISAATKMVEEQSTKEIKNGLQRMNLTLNHEIDRLKILQQKNKNIRPAEIQTALH